MLGFGLLKKIKKRGYLKAGVSLGINGLSYFNHEQGAWQGFDVDLAKAISAALFNSCDNIEFIPLQSEQRFQALELNVIDVGTFNATLTFGRETQYSVSFMEPMLYDGEAFMVHQELYEQFGCLSKLPIRVISVIRGSTTLQNLEMYFSKNKLSYEAILFDTPDQALAAYERNDCNIHCLDRILLAGERQRLKNSKQHQILPEIVTQEAMSPVVLSEDPAWFKAVKWVLKTLIEAEELGINQENIKEKKKESKAYVKQFLNPNSDWCNKLGLNPGFVESVITQVGNYADIFHRNLGDHSPLQLERGENALRSKGGLLYSPLFV